MITYAIIPARSGSKGVPNKNVRSLNGKPLIAHSIEVALASSCFDRVIVTTDSQEIADIALAFGAEVPFLRPTEFSQDQSSDRDYLEHALECFQKHDKENPELLAILRPTTPLRKPDVLLNAVNEMQNNCTATSLRSVHELGEPPQKMLQIQDGWLEGFFPEDKRKEYFNLPRQSFPTAYQPNGYIDIVKTSYINNEKEGIFGSKMIGFPTPHSVEIDTIQEFEYLQYLMEHKT